MTPCTPCSAPRRPLLAVLLFGLLAGLAAPDAPAAPPAPVAPLVVASTRFTDNGNGTVTDNLTGLIWLKQASCLGTRTWGDAITQATLLDSGRCGLTDGSTTSSWRVPNRNELQSLIDYTRAGNLDKLPAGHPFTAVQPNWYWSSTLFTPDPGFAAWAVDLGHGYVDRNSQSGTFYVWPVQGGY